MYGADRPRARPQQRPAAPLARSPSLAPRQGGVGGYGPSAPPSTAAEPAGAAARSEVKKHASVSQSCVICVCCCSTLHSPTPFFLSVWLRTERLNVARINVAVAHGLRSARSRTPAMHALVVDLLLRRLHQPSKVGWGMAVNYTLTEGAMGVNPRETRTIPRPAKVRTLSQMHVPHHAVDRVSSRRI